MKRWKKFVSEKVSSGWVRENLRHLPLLIGIQLLMYILNAISSYFSHGNPWAELDVIYFLYQIELFLIPLAAINFIFFFQNYAKKKWKSNWKRTTAKTGGLIIGIIVGTAVFEYIYHLRGIVDDDYIDFGGYRVSPVITNFLTNIFLGLVIGIPIFIRQTRGYEIQYELNAKELELNRLQQLKSKAELEALHAKINPHFLYNSLNSIASLIHDNPDKAEKMVLMLSDLFRYTINTRDHNFSTVDEELSMIQTYLEIEKVRFDEQLTFDITIDESCRQCLIPRFLIQPLVENAIKHGTSKVKEGKIRLEIKKTEANEMSITLHDNGPPFPLPISSGYGIRSIYDKLDILFPDQAYIHIEYGVDKHIRIILKKMMYHETA